MVNVTYNPIGQLTWTDPTTGQIFTYKDGDIAWTLTSTALVWIMTPGLGFIYCGLLRRRDALSMLYLSMGIIGVVAFQWFLWGFSLAFSDGASPFIGDFQYAFLRNVLDKPSMANAPVPAIVYFVYELMFATITPMLAVGAVAERARLGPTLVLIFVWSTFVYDPIACWTWNQRGWAHKKGVLDFAGGTVVHINSGATALALALYLHERRDRLIRMPYKPHNTSYVVLGTVLLWFGWFGFNGGSALAANLRAAQACIVTNLAAGVGGVVWTLWDYARYKKWSAVGFCAGAVASLVAITPGSGFVGAPAALLFGATAGTACYWAVTLLKRFNIDDVLDIIVLHGLGGWIGNILTGLLAQKSIAALDGNTVISGGWIDHNWVQICYQLANSISATLYSFLATYTILWVMHYIPGLRLRYNDDEQVIGIDEKELDEFAYDYVSVNPNYEYDRLVNRNPNPHRQGNGQADISLTDLARAPQ